jgi:hypothetical protein
MEQGHPKRIKVLTEIDSPLFIQDLFLSIHGFLSEPRDSTALSRVCKQWCEWIGEVEKTHIWWKRYTFYESTCMVDWCFIPIKRLLEIWNMKASPTDPSYSSVYFPSDIKYMDTRMCIDFNRCFEAQNRYEISSIDVSKIGKADAKICFYVTKGEISGIDMGRNNWAIYFDKQIMNLGPNSQHLLKFWKKMVKERLLPLFPFLNCEKMETNLICCHSVEEKVINKTLSEFNSIKNQLARNYK